MIKDPNLRCQILEEGIRRIQGGEVAGAVWRELADLHKVAKSTLLRWVRRIRGQPREKWPELLAPAFKGHTKEAEFTPEALEYLHEAYKSTNPPCIATAYRACQEKAKEAGWVMPGLRTAQRLFRRKGLRRHQYDAFDVT